MGHSGPPAGRGASDYYISASAVEGRPAVAARLLTDGCLLHRFDRLIHERPRLQGAQNWQRTGAFVDRRTPVSRFALRRRQYRADRLGQGSFSIGPVEIVIIASIWAKAGQFYVERITQCENAAGPLPPSPVAGRGVPIRACARVGTAGPYPGGNVLLRYWPWRFLIAEVGREDLFVVLSGNLFREPIPGRHYPT
jgi:hypothetical protein